MIVHTNCLFIIAVELYVLQYNKMIVHTNCLFIIAVELNVLRYNKMIVHTNCLFIIAVELYVLRFTFYNTTKALYLGVVDLFEMVHDK